MKYTPIILGGAAALLLSTLAQAQIAFDPATSIGVGLRPDGIALADLNGDGSVDIAVATDNPDKLELFLNNGSGLFSAGATVFLPNSSSPHSVVARDFDGDGDNDLAVSLEDFNSIQYVVNNGGTFSLGSSAGTGGSEPREMVAGDFNGDGRPDLLVGNRSSSSVSVMLWTGGGFALSGTAAAGTDVRGVTASDFDGNGTMDAAASSHDDRTVRVFSGNGMGQLVATQSLSVGGQLRPEGLTSGDLDADGDMDIAASTEGNGVSFVSVFLNTGGTFGGVQNNVIGGADPDGIVLADFDGNGTLDAATANQSSNNVSAMAGTGAGGFGASTQYAVGIEPNALATADLDGNGSPDLATVNESSNSVSVLLNQDSGGGNPSNYCIGASNSAGAGASMGSTGSLSVAANNFGLSVSGAPAVNPGVFFYGTTQVQAPFGDGFRCVGGQTSRINPPQNTTAAGSAARALDFTGGQSNITAGSTWNFQFWYRDGAAGGTGFNLSDGLSATFSN